MKNLTYKFLACIFVFTLSIAPLMADVMDGSTTSIDRPKDVNVDFQTSYFVTKPWIKEFHYVVVVNKAITGKDAQSIKVYEFGNLIISGKVSTGRDQFEAAGEHHAKKDSWSVTPTGYFTPNFLDINHKSEAYGGKWSWLVGGVKMPYAIFFNGNIALHQAPKGTESALGENASGGCIRLPFEIASDIFARIQETDGARIPKFNVDGTITMDSKGNYTYLTSAFSALIIVKNKVQD